MQEYLFRWPDVIAIAVNFALLVIIGAICARRAKSAEGYFLAGRNMAGWVVGISITATIVSSMTFLATPAFAYAENWRYMPSHFTFLVAMVLALFLFMPFFRRGHVSSAYEYLERRFGSWARLYAAAGFVIFQIFRMGIILYVVSQPVQTMTGWPLPVIILGLGVLVASYTIAGGLEAVIWTDVLQGLVLIVGGIICVPLIIRGLPNGFSTILEIGREHDKFSVGSTAFIFTKKTIWVMLLNHVFHYAQMMCTDQMIVQRYAAMRNEKEARFGLILGSLTTIPVWCLFTFIGTALFVFYKVQPNIAVEALEPIQVMPYFILSEVPTGIAGFILASLFGAAMSTLDSSINASAATITSDFYRRLFVKNKSEKHYLTIGRWLSVVFGVIMISVALIIHFFRNIPVVDLQQIFIAILSGGLLGLFLLGLLTKKVDSVAALVATVSTVLGISVWLIIDSQWFLTTRLGEKYFSGVSLPDKLMLNVVSNLFLFAMGYAVAVLLRRRSRKNLSDLTVWSMKNSVTIRNN